MLDGVKKFKAHGIAVHGMFILGLDTDTPDIASKTYKFALKSGIDSLQCDTFRQIFRSISRQIHHTLVRLNSQRQSRE